MITKHQFINRYPISKASKKLILGTIHPHEHSNFNLQFFYGNMLSIWKILNEVYEGEIGLPITLPKILIFLTRYNISMSDTILECERKNPTALDKDLVPLTLNHGLIDQIRNSDINEIYFTSGFGINNAFKLFYSEILSLKISSKIRKTREVMLDSEIFGRPIKLKILYSPSGSSNRGLSRNKIYLATKNMYVNSDHPIHDFKVNDYKNKFLPRNIT